MKILLMCNAGMSTSMLVQKMQKAAEELGVDADISASSVSNTEEMLGADVIMLGPQVSYQKDDIVKAVEGKIPVDVISMQAYGMMDGKLVLETAMKLVEEA